MTTDRADSTDYSLDPEKTRKGEKVRKGYCWAQYKIRSHRNHRKHRKGYCGRNTIFAEVCVFCSFSRLIIGPFPRCDGIAKMCEKAKRCEKDKGHTEITEITERILLAQYHDNS